MWGRVGESRQLIRGIWWDGGSGAVFAAAMEKGMDVETKATKWVKCEREKHDVIVAY
jgi:hypothetical protein